MSIRLLGTNFSDFLNQNTELFIHKNASENTVAETATILSRGDELTSYHYIMIYMYIK